MYFSVFLDGRFARGVVNLAPQHCRSLQRLAFFADPSGERLHPDHGSRLLAALQESICRLRIVLQLKVIDKTQILVEAPEFRIRANSPLQQLDTQLRFSRPTRHRLAQEHRAATIGGDLGWSERRGA